MKNKGFIGALAAAGLCGLMLTACGKKDDTADGANTGNGGNVTAANNGNAGNGNVANNGNAADNGRLDTSGADTVHGDNPGRSRDIDGDGFVEDVIDEAENLVGDAARGVGEAAHDVGNAARDVGNAARDAGNAARNALDDLSPHENDRATVTTTNR